MKVIPITISSKGQITLPKAARLQLGVKPGSVISLSLPDRSKTVTLARKPTIDDYYGKLDGFWGSGDPAEEIRAWRDREQRPNV